MSTTQLPATVAHTETLAEELERLSLGIGSGFASVVVHKGTPEERLDRLFEEAAEGER